MSVPVLPGIELSVQEDVCVCSWPRVTSASRLGGVAQRGVDCVLIIASVKHCHCVKYYYLLVFILCLHL